jgi:predicted nucleic acid-binding protein
VGQRVALFTSNYVFSETYTALLVRVNRREAIEWGRRFRSGTAIELVRVDEDVEDDAWSILEQHADKNWSHVDATSFALMAREGVDEAFSLDANFAQRGLRVLPAPA